jgi:formate dehydrogenase major subunit
MAECHPVAFRWVMEAKSRGAKIIHVDPRFTRTSAVADLHVPIRAGSDIAFLGGLIRHVIENDLWFKEYVLHYTNAPALIKQEFRDTEDLDGLFSGWDAEKGQYDPASWAYEGTDIGAAAGQRESYTGEPHSQRGTQSGAEQFDYTLQNPRCVFQILKRHFSRYTPEAVEEVCGVPRHLFLQVAKAICESSGRERTTALCYAVGWTQHSMGVQYIRTAAILQLLLGNIGRPGSGILALRGHASIQGSTDIPTLYDILPGYLAMPKAKSDTSFDKYLELNNADSGWWSEFPKYAVSFFKAWFGDAATKANGWLFDSLPRLSGDHSHMTTVGAMADGVVKGYFLMGENPAVGSMHGALQRAALRRLDWLVVRDFAVIESADFWRRAPEIERGEVTPQEIATEVFFFPCAAHTEKDGAFTNTQRLLQWHHKAIDPPGDCRSELHFVFHLGKRLRELYAGSQDPKDRGLLALTWDYPVEGKLEEPSAEAVLHEINGFHVADRQPVAGFAELKDDGSTACGCWIYAGSYKDGINQAARRKSWREQSWVAPEWGWAWPANRRILYNRAAADPEGKPWSERKKYIWWDEAAKKWAGEDVPDFIVDRPPSYRPPKDAKGTATIGGASPFIMQGDGLGWLYTPAGLLDGPLPTHYEPQEGVIENPLYGQQCNPGRIEWTRKDNPYHRPWDDPRFPYLVTTYRLTEHHTAGAMSRWLTWLSELQPEMFCEVSPELARDRGLTNGGWATITTARAEIEARVLVTERIPPLRIKGRRIHQIGLPYHWGTQGRVRGDAANELIGFVADPNVSIQESKALTGNIVAGRRSRGRRVVTSGPLVPRVDDGGERRDLPVLGHKPVGAHGISAARSQQDEET